MLAKKYRLRKKRDIEKVLKKGKSQTKDFLFLKFFANDLGKTRVGFIVSRRISTKAVVRNKIKRRLREAVKIYLPGFKSGYDLVFFARPGIDKKTFPEIKKTVEELIRKM